MNHTSRISSTCTLAVLILGIHTASSVQAQTGQMCESDGPFEPAAETLRTVELPEFNISVAIPENYRIKRLQDGTVEILHPDTYEWMECLDNGGIGGARGYYAERIRQVEPDPTVSLREHIVSFSGYRDNPDGTRTPLAPELFPYQANGLNGYIATSMAGYSVTFLGTVPGSDQLVQVSASCDCEVDIAAVAELLMNIQPLE